MSNLEWLDDLKALLTSQRAQIDELRAEKDALFQCFTLLSEENERIKEVCDAQREELIDQSKRIRYFEAWVEKKFCANATAAIKRVDPKWKSAAQIVEEQTGMSPDLATYKATRATEQAVVSYIEATDT